MKCNLLQKNKEIVEFFYCVFNVVVRQLSENDYQNIRHFILIPVVGLKYLYPHFLSP